MKKEEILKEEDKMLSKAKSFFSKPLVMIASAASIVVIAVAAVLAFNAFAANDLSEYYCTFESDTFYYYGVADDLTVKVYSQTANGITATWKYDHTSKCFTDENGESIPIDGAEYVYDPSLGYEVYKTLYPELSASVSLDSIPEGTLDKNVWIYEKHRRSGYDQYVYYKIGYATLRDVVDSGSYLTDDELYFLKGNLEVYFLPEDIKQLETFVPYELSKAPGYYTQNRFYFSIEDDCEDSYTDDTQIEQYLYLNNIIGNVDESHIKYYEIQDVPYDTYALHGSGASENNNFSFTTGGITIPLKKLDGSIESDLMKYFDNVKIEIYNSNDELIDTVTSLDGEDYLTTYQAYACYLNINYGDYVRPKNSTMTFSGNTYGSVARIPIAIKLEYDYSNYDTSKINDPNNLQSKSILLSRDLLAYVVRQDDHYAYVGNTIDPDDWISMLDHNNDGDPFYDCEGENERYFSLDSGFNEDTGKYLTYSPNTGEEFRVESWRVKNNPSKTFALGSAGQYLISPVVSDVDFDFDSFSIDPSTGFFTYTVQVEPIFEECYANVVYHDNGVECGDDYYYDIKSGDYYSAKKYAYEFKDADGKLLDEMRVPDLFTAKINDLSFIYVERDDEGNLISSPSIDYETYYDYFHKGKKFDYWSTEADGTGTKYKPGEKITIDPTTDTTGGFKIDLYAQWTDITYHIIYHANSPTGNDADVIGMPEKTHIEFQRKDTDPVYQVFLNNSRYYFNYVDGDYSNDADSNKIKLEVSVGDTGDTDDSITYEFKGWLNYLPKTEQDYNNTISWLDASPSYEYDWVVNDYGYCPFTLREDGDYEYNVYALWNAMYNITYYANVAADDPVQPTGSVPTDANAYALNDSATVLGNTGKLARKGYALKGWNTKADGKGTMYSLDENGDVTGDNTTITIMGGVALYAQWEKLPTCTVTYDKNVPADDNLQPTGNVPTDDTAYLSGETATVLGNTGNLARKGYTLKGWNTQADGSGTLYAIDESGAITGDNKTVEVTSDVTLYAQWEEITYTLNYLKNPKHTGAVITGMPTTPVNLTIGDFTKSGDDYVYTLDSTKPASVGYIFHGWGVAENTAVDDAITTITLSHFEKKTDTNGNVTYVEDVYAVWERIEYKLTYDANGFTADSGTMPSPATVTLAIDNFDKNSDDEYVYTLSTKLPTTTGYKCKGWGTANNSTTAVTAVKLSDFSSTNDLTVYAIWDTVKYTMQYVANAPADSSVDSSSMPADETNLTVDDTNDFQKDSQGNYVHKISDKTPTATGYNFTGWKVGESNVSAGGNVPFSAFSSNNTATATAQWEKQNYTVEYYEADGTTSLGSKKYPYKSSVTIGEDAGTPAEIAGKNFSGWQVFGDNTTDADGNAIGTAAFLMPAATPVKFKAVYSDITYSVTYKDSLATSASVKDSTAYKYNDTATVKSVTEVGFSHTGYRFTGWTADPSSYSVIAGDSITIKNDVTYTAQWEKQNYTVEYYEADGTTSLGSKEYSYKSSVTIGEGASTPKIIAGKNFSGWQVFGDNKTDADGNAIGTADFPMPANTIKFKAVYSDEEYTVTYKDSLDASASVKDSTAYKYNDTAAVKSVTEVGFSHTGYHFTGWTADPSSYSVKAGDSITIKNDVTYTAQWEINKYDVTYKDGYSNDTSKDVVYNVNHGETHTVQDNMFTRTGWRFTHWSVSPSTYSTTGNINVYEDVIYTANWEQIEYTVTYTVQGGPSGITIPTDSTKYHYNDTVNVAAALSAEGYSFKGWTLGGTDYAEGTSNESFTITDNVTLTGVFTQLDKVTLTYNANGGTPDSALPESKSEYTRLQTTVEAPGANFGKTGYKFTGWNTRADGKGETYTAGDPIDTTSSMDLYAQWSINSYKVNYYDSDNKLITYKSYEYNALVTVGEGVTAPSIVGKKFEGWKLVNTSQTDSTGTAIANSKTFQMPASEVNYKATYSQIEYKVTYTVQGGPSGITIPTDSTKYHYNDTVNVAAALSAEGYSFKGWTLGGKDYAAGTENDSFKITDNVTLEGEFTKLKEVTLTYKANGGTPDSALPAQKHAYTELTTTVEAPGANFGKTGYKFTGWNTQADGKSTAYTAGESITITENTDLYAQWSKDTFDVEYYDINGKTLLSTKKYTYEGTVTVGAGATAPEIAGKTFKGWKLMNQSQKDSTGSLIGTNSKFSMPAETVRFKAEYTDIEYTVSYTVSGNLPDGYTAPTDNKKYYYNNTVNVFAAPTAEGYTFTGWTLDGTDYAADTDNASFKITKNVTLVGVWTKNAPTTAIITYQSGIDCDDPNDPLAKKYTFEVALGEDYTVLDNAWFNVPGKKFNGWKVVARNVTGVSFLDTMLARFIGPANIGDIFMVGDVVTNVTEDITFEVNWEDVIYSVTYDGNGATSGTVPIDDNDYLYGDKAKVKPVGDLEKDEFDFVAWNTDPYGKGTSYTAGSEMEIKDNVTLYAIWKMKPEYTVTYDTNGATSGTAPIDPDTYKTGEIVTVLDKGDLVKEGCTFREWNTHWNGRGTAYQADDTFEMGEDNVTLYAIWVDDEGNVVSPRTGEGASGIWIAVVAMIMSVVTGGYVISAVYNKKRKNV